MGGCRFLNVILGASSLPRAFQVWGISPLSSPQLWIATGLGIYIAGVTWFARQEARQSDRRHLLGALTVANAGLLLLLAWVVHYTTGRSDQTALCLGFGVIVLLINRQPVLALRDPRPERVQGAIRVMLLSLIMLDAMLVFIKTENVTAAVLVGGPVDPRHLFGPLDFRHVRWPASGRRKPPGDSGEPNTPRNQEAYASRSPARQNLSGKKS